MITQKRCGKKGFAIQFNWLFVLLGGVVIVGFFFAIINNITAGEEREGAQKTTQELNDLLKASLASRDTQKIVFFDKKISFSCDGEVSNYHIKGGYQRVRYDFNVIFSPGTLEGRELIVQTSIFEVPFKSQPLVYVNNKDIEYVIVGSTPILTIVNNLLPENVTKINIPGASIAGYPNNNYAHTVFILTDKNFLATLSDFNSPNNKAYAIVINQAGGVSLEYGNVTFYYHDSSSGFVEDGTVSFLELETMIGAVISHNKTLYECNFKKVLERVELLSQLHSQRMINYTNLASPLCTDYYTVAKNHLDDIYTYASSDPLTPSELGSLAAAINALKSLNSYILVKTECPLIY